MGLAMLAQSPPLEEIRPIGQGHQFHFTRLRPRGQSRPSTASGQIDTTSPQESEDDDDESDMISEMESEEATDDDSEDESEDQSEAASEDESDGDSIQELRRTVLRVEEAGFEIEELGSDLGYDSDIEVLLPYQLEDADSEVGLEDCLLDQFKEMRCQPDSSDDEEQQRIYRRKKKRWSAGIFKRSHSQSVEGDSSYSDNDPLDDVDSSARRLRRRVRGPDDKSTHLFEDNGYPNSNNIVEVEEPEDGIEIPHTQGPPSIPSDDGFTLDELPFWGMWKTQDAMEVEFESA